MKWVRYSNMVVWAISVLMAFAESNWKPGMASGGGYLKEITGRVLCMPGLTPSATRTIRSPLIRLFPYIPILCDTRQVDELLEFYHARERDMVMDVRGESVDAVEGADVVESNETFLSNIRVSFVCGELQACIDAGVDCFENFVQDVVWGGRTEDTGRTEDAETGKHPKDLPFEWNLRQKRSGKFLLTVRG